MESESPSLLQWFDLSPAGFPFTPSRADEIRARRAALDSSLFFDELLALGNVDATELHPPSDPEQFTVLLDTLEKMGWDNLKKDCLIYYLLKHWENGSERKFATQRLIPPQFVALSDAYFLLDDGDECVPKAVTLLCDLRVNPDFAPKILRAISIHQSPFIAAQLIVRLVRGAKLVLTDPADLDIYVDALCQAPSILDAWLFQRSFPEDTDDTSLRKRFLTKILDHCLIPKPQAAPLKSLLGFPFTSYEQDVLNDYALHPPSDLSEASLAVLQDLISVRLIHQGRYTEAIRLDKLFINEAAASGRIGGSGGAVTRAAERRRETFHGLISVLPAVQRKLLDLQNDEKERPKPKPLSAAPSGSSEMNDMAMGASLGNISMSTSMTMSWEEVNARSRESSSTQINPLAASTASNPPNPLASSTSTTRSNPPVPLSASASLRQSGSNSKSAVLKAFAETSSLSFMEGSPSPSGLSKSKSLLRPKHRVSQALAPAPPSFEASTSSPLRNSFFNGENNTNGNIYPNPPDVVIASASPLRRQKPPTQTTTNPPGPRYPFNLSVSSQVHQPAPSPFAPVSGGLSSGGTVTPSKRPRPVQSREDLTKASASLRRWQDEGHDDEPDGMDMDVQWRNEANAEDADTEEEDDAILNPAPSAFLNRHVAAGLARSNLGGPPPSTVEQRKASPPTAPEPQIRSSTQRKQKSPRPARKLARESSAPSTRTTKQAQFPGAFPSDDPPPRTRSVSREHSTTVATRTRQRQVSNSVEDTLAPLPSPSKKPTTRRQTRASSVTTDGDESDTGPTQPRRSTRLQPSGTAGASSPDRKKRKPSAEPEGSVSETTKNTSRKSAVKGKGKLGPTRSGVTTRRQQEAAVED